MDLDNAPPFVGGKIHHRLAELNPGVVDQDVDLNALSVEMLERRENRLFVGDVEAARFDLMPGFRKRLSYAGQLLLVAAVENDSRARRCEASRHREPKPVRGSGNERCLAAEIEKVGYVHPKPTSCIPPRCASAPEPPNRAREAH